MPQANRPKRVDPIVQAAEIVMNGDVKEGAAEVVADLAAVGRKALDLSDHLLSIRQCQ
jgi:hypothetical protein